MPRLRYAGIATALAEEVRQTMRSPQYGHPAHRELARGYGPCRHCLRTFRQHEEDRLLFTYQPFAANQLPAPGPVFIHAAACPRYDADELPPEFRALPLVVEGYDAGGRLVWQERVGDRQPEEVIGAAFSRRDVAFGHLRNGEAGCFMARVERE